MSLSVEAVFAIISVAVALPLTIALFVECYWKWWWQRRAHRQADNESLIGDNASTDINSYPIHPLILRKYMRGIGIQVLEQWAARTNKCVCAVPIPTPSRSRHPGHGSLQLDTLRPPQRSPTAPF